MKFKEDRLLAAPEAAERKLLKLASAIEADHGRAPVSEINTQFMAAGGNADEYAQAVEAAVVHGWCIRQAGIYRSHRLGQSC